MKPRNGGNSPTGHGGEEPKMGPTQYKAEIERLQREGKMPTLEAVLAAIAETRAEYREKILAARKSRKP